MRKLGWLPDLPDKRDKKFKELKLAVPKTFPPVVDLRQQCPPIWNQGDLGSCTAQAIAAALEFNRHKQRIIDFTPSRLFIYYNERVMLNTVNEDSGAMIRDGIKSVAKQGAPPEMMWPYEIKKFKKMPPPRCFIVAEWFQALEYRRIDHDINQMLTCLSNGFPFVFGSMIYENFFDAPNGDVQMPQGRACGGHAMLAVGYEHAKRRLIFRNSWGEEWGNNGYGTVPFDMLLDSDVSDDFWMITKVERFGEEN